MANENLFGNRPDNAPAYPGQYVIREMTLFTHNGNRWDLLPNYISFSISEDVYQTHLRAEIGLKDEGGLAETFRLIGSERVDISIEVIGTDLVKNLRFYTTSTSPATQISDRTSVYKLNLVTPEEVFNAKYKRSVGFPSSRYSEMAEAIYQELVVDVLTNEGEVTKELVDVEETRGSFRYSFPYMGPLDMLDTLAARSVSGNEMVGGAQYVFHETMGGNETPGFKFYSLETVQSNSRPDLAEDPDGINIPKYIIRPSNAPADPQTSSQFRDKSDFVLIEEYNVLQEFDALGSVRKGLMGSTRWQHDILGMSYSKEDFLYQQDAVHYRHLSPNLSIPRTSPYLMRPLVGDIQTSSGTVQSYTVESTVYGYNSYWPSSERRYTAYGEDRQVNHDFPGRWRQLARAQELERANYIVQIKIPGDWRRMAGEVVQVSVPSKFITRSEYGLEDDLRSGRFLCTGVIQNVTTSGHHTLLTLRKDSFNTTLFNDYAIVETLSEFTPGPAAINFTDDL